MGDAVWVGKAGLLALCPLCWPWAGVESAGKAEGVVPTVSLAGRPVGRDAVLKLVAECVSSD